MSKKKFWIEFALWTILAVIVPIIIIASRYDLVKDNPSKYTGWGIIVIGIIAVFLFVLIGYVVKLMKWSLFKQVLSGFRAVVLPLIILYMLTSVIASNIENIRFVIFFIGVSEFIATFVNPFPEYIYRKNIADLKEALK